MLGAIAGDIIGSVYEFSPIKTKQFPLFSPASTFTDDTVLTVAVAEAIMADRPYLDSIREIGRRYPMPGTGAFSLDGSTHRIRNHTTAGATDHL